MHLQFLEESDRYGVKADKGQSVSFYLGYAIHVAACAMNPTGAGAGYCSLLSTSLVLVLFTCMHVCILSIYHYS